MIHDHLRGSGALPIFLLSQFFCLFLPGKKDQIVVLKGFRGLLDVRVFRLLFPIGPRTSVERGRRKLARCRCSDMSSPKPSERCDPLTGWIAGSRTAGAPGKTVTVEVGPCGKPA